MVVGPVLHRRSRLVSAFKFCCGGSLLVYSLQVSYSPLLRAGLCLEDTILQSQAWSRSRVPSFVRLPAFYSGPVSKFCDVMGRLCTGVITSYLLATPTVEHSIAPHIIFRSFFFHAFGFATQPRYTSFNIVLSHSLLRCGFLPTTVVLP